MKFVKMTKDMKAKHVEKARKNQIVFSRSKKNSYVVTNNSNEKAYRVYDIKVEINGVDVTEFMPGNKYGKLTNVDVYIKKARNIWKNKLNSIRFEDLN